MNQHLTTLFVLIFALLEIKCEDVCHSPGKHCSDDCSRIFYCRSDDSSAITIETCSEPDKLCNKQDFTCSSSTCASDFVCTGYGFFPDATDCRRSYFCAGRGNPLAQCDCDRGQVFNHVTKSCEASSDGPCNITISCEKPGECHNLPSALNPDSDTYAYVCTDSAGSLRPVVIECGGPINERTCVCPAKSKQTYADVFNWKYADGPGVCNDYEPPRN